MSDGTRDAFIENDVFGNTASGTLSVGGIKSRIFGKRRKRRKTRTSRTPTKRRRKRKSFFSRIRKHRRSSKKRSTKRRSGGIHYTKKGQPYKIMPNGRARFIKK